jgi:predicted TIM-barrel fold metal-dependent hydrolase
MGPYWNFRVPFNGPEGMLVSMNALGIDTSVVCPHISVGPDCAAGNDISHQAAIDYPGRFVGAIGINPNCPDSVMSEIRRFEGDQAMRAFKLHPALHRYPADGKAYRQVYEEAGMRGLPVTTHTWHGDKNCAPSIYAKLSKEYAETTFVLIHSGGSMEGIDDAVSAAKDRGNVYLETSGSLTFGMVERLVDGIGSERVLFGSDNPFIDPAAQVGKVVYADMDLESKLDVLGRNAQRLFAL